MLIEDIEIHKSVEVANVMIMKDDALMGYVEDTQIMLSFLDPSTVVVRNCFDDQPKFALLD